MTAALVVLQVGHEISTFDPLWNVCIGGVAEIDEISPEVDAVQHGFGELVVVYITACPAVGMNPVQNGTPFNPFTVVVPPVAVLVASPVSAVNVPLPATGCGTPLWHTYI